MPILNSIYPLPNGGPKGRTVSDAKSQYFDFLLGAFELSETFLSIISIYRSSETLVTPLT